MGRKDHRHDQPATGGPDAHGLWPGEQVFCPRCGEKLAPGLHGGRPRMACGNCGFVHYRNPGVGAAVVVRDDGGRILLVKRAPGATRPGLWSIPAGYVDYGEEVREAAARELREETGLMADIGEPVFVASNFHDPEKLTVGIWFAGTVTGGELVAGDDAEEAAFFSLDELPELAFSTDRALMRRLGASFDGEGHRPGCS